MQMEEAKEVIKIASSFLAEQEPEAKVNRLEQIEEHSDVAGAWSIVLSFPDLTTVPAKFFLGEHGAVPRVYKELIVDGKTKEVKALRFWK